MAESIRIPFLRWQCRVRQIAMRENGGRPDDAFMPSVTLSGEAEPLGHIITVLNKTELHSKLPEMQHMVRRSHDPSQRREKALQIFSEDYYQKAATFEDSLTTTLVPGSPNAGRIVESGWCMLNFEAYNQRYSLTCEARILEADDYLHQATRWHNLLFSPDLHPDTIILAFRPDWQESMASLMS